MPALGSFTGGEMLTAPRTSQAENMKGLADQRQAARALQEAAEAFIALEPAKEGIAKMELEYGELLEAAMADGYRIGTPLRNGIPIEYEQGPLAKAFPAAGAKLQEKLKNAKEQLAEELEPVLEAGKKAGVEREIESAILSAGRTSGTSVGGRLADIAKARSERVERESSKEKAEYRQAEREAWEQRVPKARSISGTPGRYLVFDQVSGRPMTDTIRADDLLRDWPAEYTALAQEKHGGNHLYDSSD